MHYEHEFEHEDFEEEFIEFLSLILLVVIPIAIIYGLCIYCYKRKKTALERKQMMRSTVFVARMEPRNAGSSTVYTVPVMNPVYQYYPQVFASSSPSCSCNNSSQIANQQESIGNKPPSYEQAVNKTNQ